jgi:hypothetical protein
MSEATYPIEKYDAGGNLIYSENSRGYWNKQEFDAKGNQTYYENSKGRWSKWEYDANGNLTYYTNSSGYVSGTKSTPIITPQQYNHAFTIAFEVISENPKGATNEEIISGLEKRLNILKNNPDEIQEATDIYDTFELE